MNNPLLQSFETPFQTPPFEVIKNEHYKPAITQLIKQSEKEIDLITNQEEAPTFENTVVALERSGKQLDQAAEIFFNLNSAETSDELQALAVELSPLLTEHGNEVMQNPALFARVKAVYEQKSNYDLDAEDEMLLNESYTGFIRSGANLSDADKNTYKKLSVELSTASLKFGENLLAETNAFHLEISDETDLAGLPEGVKSMAAQTATEMNKAGKWVFTLHAPSFVPFMEYAENRALRQKMFKEFSSKSFKGNDKDNQEVIKQIIKIRAQMASLLGYKSYADYTLEKRMANTPEKVNSFLNELLDKSFDSAKEEVEEIKEFIKKSGDDIQLEKWDWSFYSHKLKQEKYDLDDEMLRPYFKLEYAINGIFKVAEKLYGLQFKENTSIPVYHKDVKAYEVLDENGKHISVFYADFFPRKGKRGGAWMTSYRGQWKEGVDDKRPVISIVCNFTPPTGDKPSLLTFNEVNTLFHEFGHALHGILAKGKYSSLSGTSVYWDFVELPSQILENWLEEKDCLDLFAKHYETGETIPEALITKIKDASKYHAAYQMMRQLSFGILDMKWHSLEESETDVEDVKTFETNAIAKTDLFNKVEGTCLSTQFAHIFQGGYGAGYYSYKWAEVLDADAFSVFKAKGIFDKATAQSFNENILSKGGSQHPMTLYKNFRGHEPTNDALLERSGLK